MPPSNDPSQTALAQLWDGLRALVARFRDGRYWTDRRDACEELHKIARQAVGRLQQAARDRDPDIAHWGAQGCAELTRLLAGDIPDAAGKIDLELAAGGRDPDHPSAAEAGAGSAGEGRADEQVAAAALTTADGLVAWLEAYAAQHGGDFSRRATGAQITLDVDNGRKQTLFLDLGYKDSEGEPIALFYSLCGEALPEHTLWALQANGNLSGGAFAVISRQGRNMLIMLMRWRLAELTETMLRQRLYYLARKADWAEANIKEKDEH